MSYKIYKIELLAVVILAFLVTALSFIPWSTVAEDSVNGILDMIPLLVNATVVRMSISQNITFFHKLYTKHRFEFWMHLKLELPKQVLLFLCYCALEISGLLVLFSTSMKVGCAGWARIIGIEAIAN